MKKLAVYLIFVFLILLLPGCKRYHERNFVGKTAAQIIGQYGKFDCVTVPPDSDGLYRSCRCGYTVREARPGLLGQIPETVFFICFDENGVAVNCFEDARPGG